MGGNSKGGGTTVQTNNKPPAWAQPLFARSGKDALGLYKNDVGFGLFDGSSIAGPSQGTKQGIQGLLNTADVKPGSHAWDLSRNPMLLANDVFEANGLSKPADNAINFFGNMQSGQFNPSTSPFASALNQADNPLMDQAASGWRDLQRGLFDTNAGDIYRNRFLQRNPLSGHEGLALDNIRSIAGGREGIDTSNMAGVADDALAGGAAREYLTGTAAGDNLDGNPYFRQLLDSETAKVADQVNAQFSATGRYGSGAHQGVLGDTLSTMRLKGLSDNYGREREHQLRAGEFLEGAEQANRGQALDAFRNIAGFENADIGNILSGAGMQANIGAQGQNRIMDAIAGMAGADAQNAGIQAQAAAGLGAQGNALFDNLLRGASGLFGAQQQNLGNRANAATSQAGIGQGALQTALGYTNALPTLQENRTYNDMLNLQAGALQDQINQAQLNDQINRFYQQELSPWTRLGMLQSAAAGSAGQYGQTLQSSYQPFNPLQPIGMLGSLFGL